MQAAGVLSFLALFLAAGLTGCTEAVDKPTDRVPILESAEPPYGAAGTPVKVSGLDLDAPSLAAVFNGVATTPVSQTPGEAVFHVPQRAHSGKLAVRTSGGTSNALPFDVAQPDTEAWAAVSAGSHHTCGIRESGALACWGNNLARQLAYQDADLVGYPWPLASKARWLSVVGGLYLDRGNTCAIAAGGTLYCWGDNTAAQFGDGSKTSSPTPTKGGGRVSSWTLVTLGSYHTCGLSGTKLYCWGSFKTTYSGGGTLEPDPLAVQPPAGQTGWSTVAAGSLHTCAVAQPSEALYCWGNNSGGQLGIGTFADSPTPAAVASALHWRSVAGSSYTGSGATCAITTGDELWCWGYNNNGQVGDGSDTDRAAPVRIAGAWQSVALGNAHACGVTTAGQLLCWGANRYGQAGTLDLVKAARVPTAVTIDTDWATVTAGAEHTCALKTTGALYCWGNNEDGQLGRYAYGTYDPRPQAVEYTFP
jgi:alpha-tubulin suppressor-like RCC1 family protein